MHFFFDFPPASANGGKATVPTMTLSCWINNSRLQPSVLKQHLKFLNSFSKSVSADSPPSPEVEETSKDEDEEELSWLNVQSLYFLLNLEELEFGCLWRRGVLMVTRCWFVEDRMISTSTSSPESKPESGAADLLRWCIWLDLGLIGVLNIGWCEMTSTSSTGRRRGRIRRHARGLIRDVAVLRSPEDGLVGAAASGFGSGQGTGVACTSVAMSWGCKSGEMLIPSSYRISEQK